MAARRQEARVLEGLRHRPPGTTMTRIAPKEDPVVANESPGDQLDVKFTAVFMPRLTPSSKLDEFALDAMLAQSHRRKSK